MPDFWRAASAHCCNAFSRIIGLWRAVLGHVFSYNVLRRKIYPTLPRPRTYVHYRFSIISARPAGLPNRRDHGSLSQNRPRLSVNSLWLYKKKHFYTWCAGHIVHALLTLCSFRQTEKIKWSVLVSTWKCMLSSPITVLSDVCSLVLEIYIYLFILVKCGDGWRLHCIMGPLLGMY